MGRAENVTLGSLRGPQIVLAPSDGLRTGLIRVKGSTRGQTTPQQSQILERRTVRDQKRNRNFLRNSGSVRIRDIFLLKTCGQSALSWQKQPIESSMELEGQES